MGSMLRGEVNNTNLDIIRTIPFRLRMNDVRDALWKNLVFLSTSRRRVELLHPFIDLSLEPRYSQPPKDKTMIT